MNENPYAPPAAPVLLTPQQGMLEQLKSQSTWRLLGLGLITLGVYYAHYCARQSRIINKYSASDPIPPTLVTTIFAVSYASLALFIAFFFVDEHHPIAIASNISDKLCMVPVMVWGFYARTRVNTLAALTNNDRGWINGAWTFLFSPLHFNYKINVINEAPAGVQAVA